MSELDRTPRSLDTLNDVTVGGFRYSLDVVGASALLVLAHSQARWTEQLPPSDVLARITLLRSIVQLQVADVHRAALDNGEGRLVCSCGLVGTTEQAEDARGHLNLRTWDLAASWVTPSSTGGWHAHCRCGWRMPVDSVDAARSELAGHPLHPRPD